MIKVKRIKRNSTDNKQINYFTSLYISIKFCLVNKSPSFIDTLGWKKSRDIVENIVYIKLDCTKLFTIYIKFYYLKLLLEYMLGFCKQLKHQLTSWLGYS